MPQVSSGKGQAWTAMMMRLGAQTWRSNDVLKWSTFS
jgi:hypothetical protein